MARVTLADLLDPEGIRESTNRLPHGVAAAVGKLLPDCARRLRSEAIAPTEGAYALFVPGRIEVLGKHTDYAGGRSLLAALERGIALVGVPRQDDTLLVLDALSGERASFPLAPELELPSGWRNYPATVARRVARNFPPPLRGATLGFASDLPAAAGMSSSSALIIAVFLALSAINDLPATEAYRASIRTPEELAEYLASVENGSAYRALAGDLGVGTRGGSQDHTAILCARPGELVQYAFVPVRFERSVRLPPGCAFAVAASGVEAEKTGGARERYNQAAAQLRRVAELWSAGGAVEAPSLGTVLESDPQAVARLRVLLRDAQLGEPERRALLARLEHFVEESQRIVPAAGDALLDGDLERFGALVDRSQELATTGLRNQVAETLYLASSARALGAAAASAFGAGFGGSVWALVEEAQMAAFLAEWRTAYLARFPGRAARAAFFATRPGPPAIRIA